MRSKEIAGAVALGRAGTTCAVLASWALVLGAAVSASAQAPVGLSPYPDGDARNLVRMSPRDLVLMGPRLDTVVDPCVGRTDGICGVPRWTPTPLSLAGTFRVPGNDSRGNYVNYGGGAVGVSEDGKSLYLSCWVNATNTAPMKGAFVKVPIPALGTIAPLLHDCIGLSQAQLVEMGGDPNAYFPMASGILEQGGRVCVSGMITYDAANITTRNFWCGPSLTQLAGPFRGADAALAESDPAQPKPGMTRHSMSPLPVALRPYFGGATAFSTAGYSSIVSRSSLGALVAPFSPADVAKDRFPMKMVLGCPHAIAKCQTYGTLSSTSVYNGSEQAGSAFFVPGTRTLLVMERESLGPTCYGYATRNQADHGKPYLDAVYCYSLSDPPDQKGPMGYPYDFVAKAYDGAQMAAVQAGQLKPWDVEPYAVLRMPDLGGDNAGFAFGYHGAGAFNSLTGEYYVTGELYPDGQGTATVKVIRGFPRDGAAPPPPPPTAPTIESFSVAPATIDLGQTTTATWGAIANATTAAIDCGIGAITPLTGGSRPFAPAATSTCTLTATGPGGQATRTASVVVTQPPPPPPPPPPIPQIAATMSVSACAVVASANPPDTTGGWGVQFTLDGASLGTRDATAPYTRARTTGVAPGVHSVGGTWTKTGQTARTIEAVTVTCPPPASK